MLLNAPGLHSLPQYFHYVQVFVGALHGMITAHVLFSIMNDLYGNVVFVGIDTDKHKYPIGKDVL